MSAGLNDKGQAQIILFRGNEGENIRKNMINEDVIEGIVALPPKLFYVTFTIQPITKKKQFYVSGAK